MTRDDSTGLERSDTSKPLTFTREPRPIQIQFMLSVPHSDGRGWDYDPATAADIAEWARQNPEEAARVMPASDHVKMVRQQRDGWKEDCQRAEAERDAAVKRAGEAERKLSHDREDWLAESANKLSVLTAVRRERDAARADHQREKQRADTIAASLDRMIARCERMRPVVDAVGWILDHDCDSAIHPSCWAALRRRHRAATAGETSPQQSCTSEEDMSRDATDEPKSKPDKGLREWMQLRVAATQAAKSMRKAERKLAFIRDVVGREQQEKGGQDDGKPEAGE